MSANDQVILDQILSQNRLDIAATMSEADYFEMFTAEQILKDYDLSYDEIASGIVAGGNDGGFDSVYIFVNGELILEDADLSAFKKDVTIDCIFIQAKRSLGFSESALDKFLASSIDLLDLSKSLVEFSTTYNEGLLEHIRTFRAVHEKLAARFPTLRFKYYYATRGLKPHPNVLRRAEHIKDVIGKLFSASEVEFNFIGASQLLNLARRTPKTTYVLNLAESPISSSGQVGFICLVRLKDYFDFMTDEVDNLRRGIFEANVRDYQGDVQVNAGIQASLRGDRNEDFWWLNNGKTIIGSNATQSGKAITIENPYIVNGLQTSTEIFNYFRESNTEGDERNVQVKIVVPNALQSRDRIIKATNSQTHIPGASLRATEKIHRDIEEYLKPYKIFYDRRKNFYKNEGKPIDQIIGISELAQAVMAILLARPNDARARPSSLLKSDEDYWAVFNEGYDIDIYRVCAQILRSVNGYVKSQASGLEARDRNNVKFYLAMYVARRLANKANLTPGEVVKLDTRELTEDFLAKALSIVMAHYGDLGGDDQVAKGTEFVQALNAHMNAELEGLDIG